MLRIINQDNTQLTIGKCESFKIPKLYNSRWTAKRKFYFMCLSYKIKSIFSNSCLLIFLNSGEWLQYHTCLTNLQNFISFIKTYNPITEACLVGVPNGLHIAFYLVPRRSNGKPLALLFYCIIFCFAQILHQELNRCSLTMKKKDNMKDYKMIIQWKPSSKL